ncbi:MULTISPECIES: alpha/beta hydrolase [Bacillus]|uniref:AB hydrolase-1 domain-containing protein n=2 Tax=Bacillus TaxID=1386 RepID=A0A0M5JE04_9BACI|nr:MULTISPECIES: alpha/beta hydrolase [Bacillus]ALC81494.1 hypothetical protein AM592_07695 [Bacillus gobiensis]MBP1080538.1 fermentation-respiration switch protein FrsA (DUF1100 family) [Bacillus capparidis]MED1094394.1 alpha/beta hydrolase [Bacillus capparidis]
MKKLLIGIGVVFSVIFAIGIFFTNKIMYIKKKTEKEIIDRETLDGHYVQKTFDELPKDEINLMSPYGYPIKGYYIKPYQTTKTMIICHGVTMSLYNSVKYMNLFIELGWNVVIYDHRKHGLSGGKTTSYGYYEKFDLAEVVRWVRSQTGEKAQIGIHGESMGAVTALLYAGHIEDGADFYIADCPFAALWEQLNYRLKTEFKLSGKLILPVANFFLKIRDGYRIKEISPLSIIDRIDNPVLFIHSKDDDYIPSMSSQLLFEKKKGKKKIYLAELGEHAMSYTKNNKEYKKAVEEFLEEFVN